MSIKFQGNVNLAVNQSTAANFTSNPIIIDMINVMTFDIGWTGNFTGNFIIEASNQDITVLNIATVVWKPLSTLTVTAGVATGGSTFWWAEILTGARYLRLRYSFTSGTGNFNCLTFGKSYG